MPTHGAQPCARRCSGCCGTTPTLQQPRGSASPVARADRLRPVCSVPAGERSESEARSRARSWQSPCSLQLSLSSVRSTATPDLSPKTHPLSRLGFAAEKSSDPKNVQASTFQL